MRFFGKCGTIHYDTEQFRITNRAEVAELVDAHGLEPCSRKGLEVQVLSSAH
jgi:hypothetical protein